MQWIRTVSRALPWPALCMAGAASALAHEISAPAVKVKGHYEEGVGSSDAASSGAVTAARIETRPVLRAGEILEFVPGVIVTQHSGDGKANQYFLRGFNLDHGTDLAISVSGMPVNMPTHGHGQGYADLSFVIPELVSRIGYRKGPYFAEQGDFASAGAIALRYADSLPAKTATVTLGSGNYRRVLLTGSPDAGSGHLVYGLEVLGNDGPWQHPSDYRKLNGVLRLTQGTLANGWDVNLMAYDGKWDATDQIPRRAVEAGTIDRFGLVDPTDGGKSSRYSLSGSRYADFGWGRFELDAYAIRYSMNLFSNFTYFLDNPVQGDQFEQGDKRAILGIHPRVSFVGTLAGFETLTRVGLQGRFDHIDHVGLYSTVERSRTGTTREDDVKQGSLGFYAENATQWLPWLRSVVGARVDQYRFDVRSSIAQNSGKLDDQIVSPKLNLVFGPWSRTELFVNWGQGFHSNDARGTVIRVDPKDPAIAAVPVTPLVKSRGQEVGVRTEIIPGLQSSLALWELKLDSELLFIGDAGTTEASRPSRRTGLEWNNHYLTDTGWRVDLQVAATRARFTDNDPAGDRIPGAIDRVASVGVTYDPGGRWFAALQERFFGSRPLVEDNSERSPITSLTNARLGYRIDRTWQVRLDVFNLFNRKSDDITYFYNSCLRTELADPRCASGGGGIPGQHFHPVEPLAARLSVSATF
ncbi:MAG: TonB-dependent receptor [Betaproteobacteria bacterium]|jgi:outer membrane receptor protein involved in Fe transport|nr:TonB-dependent receptor [Rhodocyclaceae bacterium]MCA3133093.1 TonB-dependent receptor [Rhodocyclaceae bacterium]MCA3141828.1 TonB-dependent receptor [Rhodocyclaceae bacterium]MCA3144736.1 TonB-dependent receptor [Rhodocyclaceae bacterium]MCE2896684.1 TonB-dependent receptor [Betaproteobacteria bacterium]